MSEIKLQVRYQRHATDEGVRYSEDNFERAFLDWTMKSEEIALVMVDCWNIHPIVTHQQRAGKICSERIAPLAQACRDAGIAVIHAPSPGQAKLYPQWTRYATDAELFGTPAPPPDWPPQEFRSREGDYAQFAKTPEPELKRWLEEDLDKRAIIDCLTPQADDFVVATGDQLHRLCRHNEILHLFYCGFAANMCVSGRDYGMRTMNLRGYNLALLRDCTSAIEAQTTYPEMALTEAAILEVEMITGFTATSDDLLAACVS